MIRLALALLLCPATLSAEIVRDCDTDMANARNLYRPFEDATRSFANGAIGFVALRREEPACCGAVLMVLFPDNEIGFQTCRLITTEDEMGWSDTDLPAARARYDPATGLTVHVPTRRHDGTGFARRTLAVTVDRAAETVTVTAND
ncbi:hypothetical protein [Roseivivax sediminis]|uniref:Uncharacterized protein n=1 Tax=Roseivivax sediminis TaxID=936889 RepID=A0A1I2A740_9RHOB|nr:hypothetical protein [Roseivivax sediminis]SFE39944.1 hypothetical protein SAMN04515678_109126 [Roseivivax sediminis]